MAITFDLAKRQATLETRGLDFAKAGEVFASKIAEREDDRMSYGEVRIVTAGYLDGRFVVVVWTARGDDQHIISMRHGHEREEQRYRF